MTSRSASIAGTLLLTAVGCFAQPVYRCGPKGAIVYSHEPCLGAEVVDTTATQGMDKWTGQSRKGSDVIRSEQNRAMADAFKPLLNEMPEQRELRHRRANLPAPDRLECEKLDSAIAAGAGRAAPRPGGPASASDQSLFEKRKRFRELRC